jgi:hypothetical protein
MDIEDCGNAWCNALGRLLADLAYKSKESRHETTNGKGRFGEAVKFNIIDQGGMMSMLEVVLMSI